MYELGYGDPYMGNALYVQHFMYFADDHCNTWHKMLKPHTASLTHIETHQLKRVNENPSYITHIYIYIYSRAIVINYMPTLNQRSC